MNRLFIYLRLVFLLITPSLIFSQETTDSLIQQMYRLWESSYTSYHVEHMSGEVGAAYSLLEVEDSSTIQNLEADILAAESDLMNKDWGLDWSGGYVYNTAPGMDVADNILYKSRIQTQVSWSIINNGFIENKARSKVLENESEIASLSNESQLKTTQDILSNWHKVIYRFNQDKITVLEQRLLVAEQRVSISYQLKSLGKITHEELLKNLESYAEISSLFKIYKDYNEEIENRIGEVPGDSLPLIDINYKYGLDQLDATISDKEKELMIENLELKNKGYHNIDLKIYSRYNYYDLINNPLENRAFLTFGVGVGVPIAFQKKEKEKLFELEKQQILEAREDEGTDLVRAKNDLLNYFYEFRYKLKQFNSFYYKKLSMKELLKKEQARYDVQKLDFNPLKALRWLDESMSIDIELIDLKQQLYLQVLKMQSVAPQMNMKDLVVPLVLEDLEIEKVIKKGKEVYIWSKTLTNHSLEMLINYLVINNVTKVVLSASAEKSKLNSFIVACKEKGIVVEIMIGDNQFISENSADRLEEKLLGISLQDVSGIHLDVEPQTFDDWDVNKNKYTKAYNEMYQTVSDWCNGNNIEVSVSLPTYFPEETVRLIQKDGGQVYFMCYENVSTSFLTKKLEKYKGSDFTIALRPEDFENMSLLEEKIEELQNLFTPSSFIIHDLERLLKFDP